MRDLKYLHGSCHVFAVALNKELGYPIQLMLDEYDLELGGEALIHAYCVKGGKAIDARGKVSLDSVLDEFDYNEPYTRDVTVEEIDKLIGEGFLHEYMDTEIIGIRDEIRNNNEKFKVD